MNILKFKKSEIDSLVDAVSNELKLGSSEKARQMASNLLSYMDYLETRRVDINKLIDFARNDIRDAQAKAKASETIDEKLKRIEIDRAEKEAEAKAEKKALKKAKIKAEAEAKVNGEIEARARADANVAAEARKNAEAKIKAEAEAEDARYKEELKVNAKARFDAEVAAKAETNRLAEINAKAIAEANAKVEDEIAKAKLEIERLRVETEQLKKAKADAEEIEKVKPVSSKNQETETETGKKKTIFENKKSSPSQQIPDLFEDLNDSGESVNEVKPASKKAESKPTSFFRKIDEKLKNK